LGRQYFNRELVIADFRLQIGQTPTPWIVKNCSRVISVDRNSTTPDCQFMTREGRPHATPRVSYRKYPHLVSERDVVDVISSGFQKYPTRARYGGLSVSGPARKARSPPRMRLRRRPVQDMLDSLPTFPTLSEATKLVALAFTRDVSKLSCI